MSLADELLADLEEAAEEEEGGSYGEEEEEPAIEDVQEETQLDLSGDSVKSIAKLWDSKMVRWYPMCECSWEEEWWEQQFLLRALVSDYALIHQFAEIMMKIEEYISKQAKASEGTTSPSLSSVCSPDLMALLLPVVLNIECLSLLSFPQSTHFLFHWSY